MRRIRKRLLITSAASAAVLSGPSTNSQGTGGGRQGGEESRANAQTRRAPAMRERACTRLAEPQECAEMRDIECAQERLAQVRPPTSKRRGLFRQKAPRRFGVAVECRELQVRRSSRYSVLISMVSSSSSIRISSGWRPFETIIPGVGRPTQVDSGFSAQSGSYSATIWLSLVMDVTNDGRYRRLQAYVDDDKKGGLGIQEAGQGENPCSPRIPRAAFAGAGWTPDAAFQVRALVGNVVGHRHGGVRPVRRQ